MANTFEQKRPTRRQAGTVADTAARAPRTEPSRREGEALPNEVRQYFEPRFGFDFSKVRIHADSDAARGARSIQARAYTLGHDIVFGAGEYAPATSEGRRLIAHELAHVVQQDGGSAIGGAAGPIIRRQPLTKPTRHTVTQDEVVQTMTGLGGPYADTAAWEASMQSTTFLGHGIAQGVRPEFKAMLATAESKVKDEYKKSGNTPPPGYGITFIGGYRREISPHGAGVAIDIDGGDNPYIMHEGEQLAAISDPSKQTALSKELGPVYTRIAQFILNSPIDGEQSVIPKLITTGDTLPKGQKSSRRDRVGQYYDRLAQESEAMKKYFTLMQNDAALQAFLTNDWPRLHPGETAPSLDATKTQMWNDYALLGGPIPKGGPAGVTGFTPPRAAGRPFHPSSGGQKDPAAGFLTMPREVVLGLGQAVPRWGAIDFSIQSGDVMHFDDRYGLGKPFYDAFASLNATADADYAKAKADYEAAIKAEKEKRAQPAGGGSGAGTPTPQPGSGSAAPTPQRKAIPGAVNDPLERQADAIAESVTRMEQPARASVPGLALAHLSGPVASDRAGAVRRAPKNIQPEDVAVEMVGQKFRLREAFTVGTVKVPVGEGVTVTSWDNAATTVEVTSPSVMSAYRVPKYLLDPERPTPKGIAPYGAGLGKVASSVERGAAVVAAFQGTESTYRTTKGKAVFAKELGERQAAQASREGVLNKRLIQATMLNRFDTSIQTWVAFYNNQFGFKGKDALDPNLIKSVAFQESQMGTSVDIDDDPTTGLIFNRFNILQAVDTLAEEQIPVIQEIMPALVTKYHLDDVVKEWKKKENDLDDLRKKQKSGRRLSTDETTRLTELTRLSDPGDNWQTFFWENKNFMDALKEFLNGSSGGKKRSEDYDFWIRTGVRAVFEKHTHHSNWVDAARAFNGGGRGAANYRKSVEGRVKEAASAEKAGKEYEPHSPGL